MENEFALLHRLIKNSSDLYSSPKIRKAQNEQSKHCLSKFEQSLIADLMQFF